MHLPAPGYRDRGEGTLWSVGSYGYSQSSWTNGHNGVWLEFRPTLLDPSFTFSRAYGLPLRCLSE
ncbi:hypothetical protein [uncultured Rikenella sp.]|uniref:hypothetical protein n=1 Tax=uncultured Rikenella sp. TaxID=368003 RepID=UPI0025E4E4A0|nr:hypothetical protein [uncultured Rikenella sp.]